VIVTRPAQQAAEFSVAQVPNLCHALAEMGAAVIEAPSIEIEPVEDFSGVDGALRRLDRFDIVVFTSPNGVEAFAARCRQLGLDGRALGKSKVAAIGAATASALRGLFIQPDTMPAEFTTEALADALLAAGVSRKRILLARADPGAPGLARRLREAGAVVEDVAFYRTCRPSALPEDALAALKAGKVDWLTFTSSSSVDNFLALLASAGVDVSLLRPCKLAAIGPVTARTLANHGLSPAVTATEHTLAGLMRAMVEPK
jgi:uroporphyrinogen III methyltransferase/synthase